MRLPLWSWTDALRYLRPALRRGRRARKGRALAGQQLEARALLDGDTWISVSSAWVTAPGSLVFTIDYSNLPDGTAISYSTDGGMPGTDYSPVSGSSAASGSGSLNVTVSTFDDGMGGTDYLSLNASGGGASAQGMGSIDEPSGGGGGGGSPTDLSLAVSPTPLHTGDNAYLNGSFDDSDSMAWFNATVDWGDGTTDAPSITGTGFYDGHTYTEPGTFTIGATVSDQNGQSTSGTTMVTVSDPTLAIQGFSVSPASADVGNQIFASGDITGIVFGRNYFETIDWGDGATDNVSDGGRGNLQDSHVYATPGDYIVIATVSDDHDRTASARASEKISDPPLAIEGFGLSPASTDEGNQVYASATLRASSRAALTPRRSIGATAPSTPSPTLATANCKATTFTSIRATTPSSRASSTTMTAVRPPGRSKRSTTPAPAMCRWRSHPTQSPSTSRLRRPFHSQPTRSKATPSPSTGATATPRPPTPAPA